MKKLLMIGMTVATALVTMPALAIYYVSHWDFSSDPAVNLKNEAVELTGASPPSEDRNLQYG